MGKEKFPGMQHFKILYTYLHPSSDPSPLVPDVSPDASMVNILSLTVKKVCESLSDRYKSLKLLAFSTVPTFSKHKVLYLLTSTLPFPHFF
jgi:hypothetical protein